MRREDFYVEFLTPIFNLSITPLSWWIPGKHRVYDRGDYNDHEFWFLCFYVFTRILSKKGRDGKKYRKEFLNAATKQEAEQRFNDEHNIRHTV